MIALLLAVWTANAKAGTNGTWIDTTSGGLWSNPANWSGGTIADGTGGIADFSTLNITAGNTVHLDNSRTIGTLKFGDTTPSNDWTLDNNGSSANVLTLGVSSGSPVVQVNNRAATIGTILAGSQGFNMVGSGTLILAGANTLSGTTTLSTSTLQLGNANALQNSTINFTGGALTFGPSIGTFTVGGLSATARPSLVDVNGSPVTLAVGNNNGNSTLSFGVSGSGSLVKIGTGTLTMTGFDYNYSGNTVINDGVLLLGASVSGIPNSTVAVNVDGGLAFGPATSYSLGGLSGSNNFSLVNNSMAPVALTVGGNSANTTYSGVMSGRGSVTKIGTGILTLTGTNLYTGGTTISAGALQLGNPDSLQNSTIAVNVNNGLKFSPSIGTFTLAGLSGNGGFALTDTSGAAVTLQVGNNNANSSYGGAISGSGSLTKIGTGTLELSNFNNTYSGLTTINGGALKPDTAGAQDSTVVVNVSGGLVFNGASTFGGLAGAADFALVTTSSGPASLTVGNDNANTAYSGVMSGSGSLTKIGTGVLTLNGASTYIGTTTITTGALQFGNANALQSTTIAIDANSGLVFVPAIGTFTIGGLGRSGSNMTAFGNFTLTDIAASPITLQVGNDNANTTYSGAMSGAGSLTKIGTGTLALAGANTYSGNTAISAGVLQLGNANALQNSSVAVNVDGGLAFSNSATTFTVGGLTGSNSFSLATVGGGAVTLSVGGNNASTTYSGVMSDSRFSNLTSSVAKVGTGTLTLGGANTYGGFTTISAGTVQLANPIAVQNSTVAVNVNGGLAFSPGIGTFTLSGLSGSGNFSLTDMLGNPVALQVGGGSYSGVMSGSGSLTQIGFGTLMLSGANAFNGPTTVTNGGLYLDNANALQNSTLYLNSGVHFYPFNGGGPFTYTLGGISGSGSFLLKTFDGHGLILQVGNNDVNTEYDGALSAGSYASIGSHIVKVGTGTLTLTGLNSIPLIVNAGSVQLGTANTLHASYVEVDTNGGLAFAPGIGSFNIAQLSGSNDFSLTDTSGAAISLNISNSGGFPPFFPSTTYSGIMSGGGGLTYAAGGTVKLTLSGANTYSGPTVVESGVIQVTGSLANNGSDKVSVGAGSDFSAASISRRVQPAATYMGLGSTAIGSLAGLLGSNADIRAGQDNNTAFNDVAMQWRVGNANDSPRLVSDVLNLTGMSSSTGSHVQTDPFVLQMTYNTAALDGSENVLAANGLIDLAWLNTGVNQPNGLWQYATAGNFGTGMPGDVFQNVQSSWDAFAAANSITDSNVGNFLGSYGVDVAHQAVWAVVNHNSQFAVVPEPSSVLLLAIGGLAILGARLTRKARTT